MTPDKTTLPVDSQERKRIPLCTGVLDYFAAALAEVAKVSATGNEKHNPGQPLHWSREKSADHADCCARHLMERGGFDEVHLPDGRVVKLRHTAELAWRALALLQEELEAAGEAPPSRGSRFPVPQQPRVDGGPVYVPPEPGNVLLRIVTCDADLRPHVNTGMCENPRPSSSIAGLLRGPHEAIKPGATPCGCTACGHGVCPTDCDCPWCDR